MLRSNLTALAILAWGLAGPAVAEVSATLSAAFPGAVHVKSYTPSERARAAHAVLRLETPARLAAPVSLTPNQSYAADGSALNIWKPSFVVGTTDGGEVGLNFWDQPTDGHVNVALTPGRGDTRLLDCRFLTRSQIRFKVYSGTGSTPLIEQAVWPSDHHVFVAVPASGGDQPVLVEFWPSPPTAVVAFFGCDISAMG